jgi:hypothetical protein
MFKRCAIALSFASRDHPCSATNVWMSTPENNFYTLEHKGIIVSLFHRLPTLLAFLTVVFAVVTLALLGI